ncbi:phosphopantetheinyl transferase [Escherichia coli]|nr:phosphopantetheinyl transferase [Escherichia coli]
MATHFARGILTEGHLISVRLPSQCHQEARNIPPHRQSRFLASRGLLAETDVHAVWHWRIAGNRHPAER